MMAASASAQQYLVQQIQTASKEQLLLMLFDGAIRFLKVARRAMDTGDIQTTHANLLKTQKIITELMASLDMAIGGEPASNLMALYEYYYYRLVQANLKKDPAMVDEVIDHLSNLRQTWDEAIRIAAGHKTGRASVGEPASTGALSSGAGVRGGKLHDEPPSVSRSYSA